MASWRIPPHLSRGRIAALRRTVWHAMMEHAKLKGGDTVLLQGTGSIFVCNSRMRSASAPSSLHRAMRSSSAQSIGAAFGINYKTTPQVGQGGNRRHGARSRGRSRRRGNADALVGHPRRRQDHLDRRVGAEFELNPGLIFPPRQCAGVLNAVFMAIGRRSQRDQAGDRQGVRLHHVQAAYYKHMASGAPFSKIAHVGVIIWIDAAI